MQEHLNEYLELSRAPGLGTANLVAAIQRDLAKKQMIQWLLIPYFLLLLLKLTIQIFREEDGGVGLSRSPREDRERPPMTGASATQPAPPFMKKVS